jgi:hypothetical protein
MNIAMDRWLSMKEICQLTKLAAYGSLKPMKLMHGLNPVAQQSKIICEQ